MKIKNINGIKNIKIKILSSVLILFVFSCLLLATTYGATLNTFSVTKKPIRTTIVSEFFSLPVKYEVKIKNLLPVEERFSIFTLLNALMFPNEQILLQPGEEKTINVTMYVNSREPGKYSYAYYIKNSKEEYQDVLTFTIVPGDTAFFVEVPDKIKKDSETLKIDLINNLPYEINNLIVEVKGDFIDDKIIVNISGEERKELNFNLQKDKLEKEWAGEKSIIIILSTGEALDKQIIFKEKLILEEFESIKTEEKSETIFIGKRIEIKKTNEGNTPVDVSFGVKFNAIEKMFLSSNIKPQEIKKEEDNWVYIFKTTLKPGESIDVKITVNYAWVVILLIAIIILIVLYWALTREKVEIIKNAKQVKIKSGHFALRIELTIKNKTKSQIKDVAVLDYLPISLKYHEYGLTLPDEISGNRLYWKIGDMNSGEERKISYIAFSNVKFEGELVLPSPKIKYIDRKGNKKVKSGNKAKVLIRPITE